MEERWTRMLGTLAASFALYWRGYYWPERFDYVSTPLCVFLLAGSHFFDLAYPIAFVYVDKEEEVEIVRKTIKTL